MKRISIWLMSTLSASVLLLTYHTSTSGPSAAAGPAGSGTRVFSGAVAGAATTPSTPAPSTTATGGTGATQESSAKTVTGQVAQTQWGPVQVQLEVAGQKITKVSVVQYPQGNPRDDEINSYALPILIQETTQQQSAQIDMVSGATVTSGGYLQSLQSALDQAGM